MSQLPEKCPQCGAEMEKGYMLASGPALFWSREEKKIHTIFDTEVLVGRRITWNNVKVRAYKCPTCKIVLFSYEKEEE